MINSLINTGSSLLKKRDTLFLKKKKRKIYIITISNNIQNGKQIYMINSLINTNSNFIVGRKEKYISYELWYPI